MLLPRPRANVSICREQLEVFLVDAERGEIYQLNETAAQIFAACAAGFTVDQAVAVLLAGLSEPDQAELVRSDVCAVIEQLLELGVCEPAQALQPRL